MTSKSDLRTRLVGENSPSDFPRNGFRSIGGRCSGICGTMTGDVDFSVLLERTDGAVPSVEAKSVIAIPLTVSGRCTDCDGRRIEDRRRMFRDTIVSTCSFETLTTRCDIFRSIVPVLISGDSAEAGDSDRFRLEDDLFRLELPISMPGRSSPNRDPLDAVLEGPTNRTLTPELRPPKLDPLLLS